MKFKKNQHIHKITGIKDPVKKKTFLLSWCPLSLHQSIQIRLLRKLQRTIENVTS